MPSLAQALALALEHHQAGRLAAAEQIYRQVLAVEPRQADALHLLGLIAHQAGRHDLAVQHITQAIASNGAEAAFHNNLGEAYRGLRQIPAALACYRRALELQPNYAEAHNNLGNALDGQGHRAEAIACYRRALQLNPALADTHNNLGTALQCQGNLDEAIACYRRALELKPDFAEAHNNLGSALQRTGRPAEAAAACREALRLRPDFAAAHHVLGEALLDQGRLDEALASFRRALEVRPDDAEAHNALGVAFHHGGQPDQAAACYRQALRLKPDFGQAHYNLGITLAELGATDEAAAAYRRALELTPDFAEAHVNQAMLWLLLGDFRRGWPEYEWRWRQKSPPARPPFPQPAWSGESLAGKTCLLYAEQGLGDTIQFIRYAAVLKRQAAAVIVQCQPSLLALLARCPGVDQLLTQGDAPPPFDVQAPLLSVPALLGTTLETIPRDVPYVQADPAVVKKWRQKLAPLDGFRIGINWQGRSGPGPWIRRNIPLEHFATLAAMPSIQMVSLQKEVGSAENRRAPTAFPLWEPGRELDQHGAFTDTAAIMAHLNLVITSDTAVAHVAGALGVPVWLALPHIPDWRWLLDRADSPWYPTMRVFRQKSPGDWNGVFEEIAAALRAKRMKDEG